jgi:arylsulfatase A-like enzyme
MKFKFLISIGLLGLISFFANAQEKSQKPNIIFILLDDMGKEWVSNFGAEDIHTPNIDQLAETGVKFTNVYSMPQCTPSRVTLLTGQYPWRHGWVNHYDVPRWGNGARFDAQKNPSYAKMLREAGYKTCVAGKWQINDFRLEPEAMIDAGFDEYCMWTGAEGGNEKISQERYWDPYIHTKEGSKTYKGKFGEDVFTDFIIDFMEQNKDQPMMVYYPMCLPHGPLTTTPLEPNVKGKNMHKAMVRYTDEILRKIVKALDDLEIRDNTVIFWTTDNGTSGNIIGHRNGKAVRGGKTYLTENGINAPFIVNAPGFVPGGRTSDELIDFTDLLPTFCELAGIRPKGKYTYDGYSFAPLIRGNTDQSERDWIMSLGSHPAKLENGKLVNAFVYRDRVIRDQNYKAYVDTCGQIYELVDVKNDFYEQTNIISSSDKEAKKALKKFKKVLKTLPKQDHYPLYQKADTIYFNLSKEELLEKCNKGKKRGNKSKLPY